MQTSINVSISESARQADDGVPLARDEGDWKDQRQRFTDGSAKKYALNAN